MPHRVEQADRGQHRHAQRQHHLPQHQRRGGAVDQRRLLQALRDGVEEVAHDQHPPRVDELRNHQRPQGVVQAGVAHYQVGRDQAAVEQDGEEHEHRDRLPPRHATLGQGVGERCREQQVQRRAHHHPEQGHAVGSDDRAALGEDGLILQTLAVDVGVDDVGHVVDHRIVQQQDLLEAGVDQVADVEDQQNGDHHGDRRQGDADDLLQLVGVVDDRRLVQLRVHAGQRD